MTGINGQVDTVEVGIKVIYDSVLVLQFFSPKCFISFLRWKRCDLRGSPVFLKINYQMIML